MTADEKFKLITRNLEETLTEEELKTLIESGKPLKHYIGFEISGQVHLGQGLAVMQKVKEVHDAGVETTIFLADWHSWINNKLDGKLKTATKIARDYFKEAMKAAYICVGGDSGDLKFILGSELYDKSYWPKVIAVAKATTISRMIRSTDIMGRLAGDSSEVATLFYPAMQAADIFQMGINIAHAGTDQRNVHVVAREAAKNLSEPKPVTIHHHLILGLSKPDVFPPNKADMKMSKSKPDSAVFITDSPEDIKRKVSNAFCPEGEVDYNPILDWSKYLIFYEENSKLEIKRDSKFGGDITYTNYADLEKDYADKKLHPMDLKN
ncbi:tyrosine--tRNA ligase, partial [Patescibacteria group bacterium]|nr:tyrosine--tRNA ligase [Patescibacteria group bacterium]